MKIKVFFLGFLLAIAPVVLFGDIIFPKAPDSGQELVTTNVGLILQRDTHFFSGLKIEDLTVARPYREYFVVNLTNLVAGHLLAGTATRSWRYLLMLNTNAVGAATLIENAQGALKYNNVQRSFFPNAPLDAFRMAEQLPQIKRQDYEVRGLNIAPLNFTAIWLRGKSDDIIIPLQPTFGRFNENQPYSERQIIKVLKKSAEDVIQRPNLLR